MRVTLLREGEGGEAVELRIIDKTSVIQAWTQRVRSEGGAPPHQGVPVHWYGYAKFTLLSCTATYHMEHATPVVVGYVTNEGQHRMLSITWEPAAYSATPAAI